MIQPLTRPREAVKELHHGCITVQRRLTLSLTRTPRILGGTGFLFPRGQGTEGMADCCCLPYALTPIPSCL
jgi:hypothetical protein